MADQGAIAAVSRTLRTLLRDRMVEPSVVTLAPPDVTITEAHGARVNLYLVQVIENAELKNQEIPFHGPPRAYGRPPLSLNLRYLMTTHSATESLSDSDITAQTLLGDAMRVLHDFGNRVDNLTVTTLNGGTPGDPIIDPGLANEFERLRITLHPTTLDDLTRVWSAMGESNFRRSVMYEVTVVQIETPEPRTLPRPVERRRILATVRSRPVIVAAYVTVTPTQPRGELRVRIGDSLTVEADNIVADRLYVRVGSLDPIRVTPTGKLVTITVPDDMYPADLDHPLPRPIPATQQLLPGPLAVQLIAHRIDEGVEGALDPGQAVTSLHRHLSNVAFVQLVPEVASVLPGNGNSTSILTISGRRLWHPAAHEAEVVIGDAGVLIREPGPGDAFAAPTPTVVQIPVAAAAATLPVQSTGSAPYPVAVQVDGARSRDAVGFVLEP